MTLHLSGLPGCPTPGSAEEFAVTNELRTRGTDYLLEAARLAGIRRFIAQSFTIVDDEPAPAAEWVPFLARCLGAETPQEIPASLRRELAGEFLTAQMTIARGSSNAKAKRVFGCEARADQSAGAEQGRGRSARSAPAPSRAC
jgi:hypothetical protein